MQTECIKVNFRGRVLKNIVNEYGESLVDGKIVEVQKRSEKRYFQFESLGQFISGEKTLIKPREAVEIAVGDALQKYPKISKRYNGFEVNSIIFRPVMVGDVDKNEYSRPLEYDYLVGLTFCAYNKKKEDSKSL